MLKDATAIVGIGQTPFAKKLEPFAEEVDQRLNRRTAKTSEASKKYARAIEKGSNDKARRMDRHEALIEIIKPFLRKKKK